MGRNLEINFIYSTIITYIEDISVEPVEERL